MNEFQLQTVSSLNIPIIWTNFTYERFLFWNNFENERNYHHEIFFKNERITAGLNSFQLKTILKKDERISKRHEPISGMNGFLL
jgi:hypothetical protein